MFNLFKKHKRERLPNPDGEGIIGKFTQAEGGGQLTHVIGEKYPIRGNPQFGALMALEPVKTILDKIICSRLAKIIPFNVDNSRLSEPVQEIARVFDLLIEAEKLEGNKRRWQSWKKVLCVFLEHDIAYRYRFQWLMERINKDKVKLTEGDKYFLRVKNFRTDLEEEWEEAIKKWPQLKIKQEEFKEWLAKEQNWFKEDDDRYLSLEQLAPRFLKTNETI